MDNLNTLSLKELKDLQAQVAKAIATFEDRKKKEALFELQEIARAKGFTLEELTGTSVVRRRAPASAKYANPADKSDTWSGRGRKPRWFIAALASGQQPEDLAV
ncbi:MAG: transcriptional regulator [Rhodobacterales bacterium 17-64-5]|nr:MAG: transcriptional regulator [Rhodobacterales bacterium 17-64-5]